jgi:hypothetical protein
MAATGRRLGRAGTPSPRTNPHRGSHHDANSALLSAPRGCPFERVHSRLFREKRQSPISDACCRLSSTDHTLTPLSAAAEARRGPFPSPKGRSLTKTRTGLANQQSPRSGWAPHVPTRKAKTAPPRPGLANASPRLQAPSVDFVPCSTAAPRRRVNERLDEHPIDLPPRPRSTVHPREYPMNRRQEGRSKDPKPTSATHLSKTST